MGLPGEQGVISCPHKIINSLWKHHNLTLLKQTETLGRGSVMCRTLSCGAAAGRAKMLVCTAETKMVIWKTGRERLCKSSRKWLFNSLTEMMMSIFFQLNLLSCLLIVFIFINNYFIFLTTLAQWFSYWYLSLSEKGIWFLLLFSALWHLCLPVIPLSQSWKKRKQTNKINPTLYLWIFSAEHFMRWEKNPELFSLSQQQEGKINYLCLLLKILFKNSKAPDKLLAFHPTSLCYQLLEFL